MALCVPSLSTLCVERCLDSLLTSSLRLAAHPPGEPHDVAASIVAGSCSRDRGRRNSLLPACLVDKVAVLFATSVCYDQRLAAWLYAHSDDVHQLRVSRTRRDAITSPHVAESSLCTFLNAYSLRSLTYQCVSRQFVGVQYVASLLSALTSTSAASLRSLEFSGVEFHDKTEMDNNTDTITKTRSIDDSLIAFQNLTVLNVHNSDFNDADLVAVCSRLRLHVLNVSRCTQLTNLQPTQLARESLCELYASNVSMSLTCNIVALRSLYRLTRLNVSSPSAAYVNDDTINQLLANCANERTSQTDVDRCTLWPTLRYLDVSGWQQLREDVLCTFIKSHPHITIVNAVTKRPSATSFHVNIHVSTRCCVIAEIDIRRVISSLRSTDAWAVYCALRELYAQLSDRLPDMITALLVASNLHMPLVEAVTNVLHTYLHHVDRLAVRFSRVMHSYSQRV
jgi:hypothetical protein